MALSKKVCSQIAEALIEKIKEGNAALGISREGIPQVYSNDLENIITAMRASDNHEGKQYFVYGIYFATKSLDEPKEKHSVEYFLVGTNGSAMWRTWVDFYKFILEGEKQCDHKDKYPEDYMGALRDSTNALKLTLEDRYGIKLKDFHDIQQS